MVRERGGMPWDWSKEDREKMNEYTGDNSVLRLARDDVIHAARTGFTFMCMLFIACIGVAFYSESFWTYFGVGLVSLPISLLSFTWLACDRDLQRDADAIRKKRRDAVRHKAQDQGGPSGPRTFGGDN